MPLDSILMAVGITMVIGSLGLSLLVLLSHWYFERLLPAKQIQRTLLQQQLRQFAIANRHVDVTEKQLDAFWADTQNSYVLGSTSAISEVRGQLYEKSTLLLKTRQEMAQADTSLKRRNELLHLHSNTIQWFSGVLIRMDSLFVSEREPVVSVQDVWGDLARVLGRSLRI